MCLIVHREPGASGRGSNIPNEVIAYNSRINPDGFGIAWRESNGELKSAKFAPNEFLEFRDLLKTIDRDNGVEYVAHFRRATHGPACTRLSHPFTYEDKKDGPVLVFHNGVLSIDTEAHESDTSTFVDRILSALKPRWWGDKALRYLVEEAIGYSRILVMTAQETVRLNQKLWDLHGGIYYSTNPFPPTVRTASTYGGTVTPIHSGNIPYPALNSGKGVESSAKGASMTPTTPDTDDDDDWEELLPGGPSIGVDDQWVQQGHVVAPLGTGKIDSEGDTYGTAVCETCHTIGDYYLIEGKVYLDVNHLDPDDDYDPAVGSKIERAEERITVPQIVTPQVIRVA